MFIMLWPARSGQKKITQNSFFELMILIGRGFELNTLKIFLKRWIGLGSNLTKPSGVEDFLKNYSQHTKLDQYKKYLEPVSQDTFSCECSRKDLLGTDHYPGTCRDKNLAYKEDLNLRLKPMDVIIYKKDLLPSYHWSCVIDDYEMNITHLIRGEDLIPSI